MSLIPATVTVPDFILNNDLFLRAANFSHKHHDAVGQKREGSGEPYIVHPLEVAGMAHAMGHEFDYPTDWIEVAVVRDTVFWLTDVVDKPKGNRRVRKELERVRLMAAPGRVKFIKCCDIIANARCILKDKPQSAQLFLTEKMAVLDTFVHYNRMHKGTDNIGKLDKQMLAKCRAVLVEFMDTISKP